MQERNQDLSLQLIAYREMAYCSAIDFSVERGKLAVFEDCYANFKEDYHYPIESLSKSYNLAITRERQWREKREELAAAQVEIAHLRGQLIQAPDILDHAFAFEHGAEILRLRNRLLATPDTNLVTLYMAYSP